MLLFYFLFLLALTLVSAGVKEASFIVPQTWKNLNLLRTVDLTTPIVREVTAFVAFNTGDDPSKEYYFPVSEERDKHLAWISANERKTTVNFEVEKAGFDTENRVQFYKISFNRLVDAQEKITVEVKTVFTHILKPIPHEIPQNGKQYLLYIGNLYASNAYFSEKQRTIVNLPSPQLLSYTTVPEVTTKNDKQITYGFFNNTQAYIHEPLSIHYPYQKAILRIKSLRRELEVSHWGGNLAVEETFDLINDGARLQGQFSRLEYQRTQYFPQSESIAAHLLSIIFPPGAADAYYRDEIGNVSTSNFRNEPNRSVFEFKPRYPLFGGWNYTWYHGYNLPLNKFLRYHEGKERFYFNAKFIERWPDVVTDKIVVKLILPEGARDVQVHLPFKVRKQSHGIHKTYLDTIGRYLVTIEAYNFVDEHVQDFQVSYAYDSDELFRKPLSASTFFLGLFLLSAIYSRMEFNIKYKKTEDLKEGKVDGEEGKGR
ncbi:9463_t:CDS:2 [Paraglomus brasilianum]|uniref:Dolichyl-diphosphooligosaccharide--protein glycosyltransferase subunit 1 n=1 Tax=Paraglomus brasilianum TaxID=144538 RepID=A0A9N9BFA4_9GLOM|nr:9463_t:CDS:2 [Paraglomus brasilianum]